MEDLILVVNCSSSLFKATILNSRSGDIVLSCLAAKLGQADAYITFNRRGNRSTISLAEQPDHHGAAAELLEETRILGIERRIRAIGHRVVHGGEHYSDSVRIDDKVIAALEACIALAPLHNPANLTGIRAAQAAFPNLPNVAVFDTAFHQTLPQEAYLYALPYKLYQENGIRRYGAHGTSHRFIAEETAKALGKPLSELNIINCHLGNGASVCAIKNGESVDTSMGLTPLEGLAMGTRSGDIDPAVVFFMHDQLGYSVDEINHVLTRESGLLGMTEVSSDCRYVTTNYATDAGAKRALDVFTYRVAKYVGAYAAAMDGRLDALVFTGGIGENAAMVREMVLARLALFGFKVDKEANNAAVLGGEGPITAEGSRLALVMPTNEELVIARDALSLVG